MQNRNRKAEVRAHLIQDLIPFWKSLRDEENGGFYGQVTYGLKLNKEAQKGCILNSRITWFFANAYLTLKDESLLAYAKHGYDFLKNHCVDKKNGGVYWSVTYDGKPEETLKHTYNQAFSIYALSSYYDASGDKEALSLAYELYDIIETKMRDEQGYKEAFDESFHEIDNEKLSENGVMAAKTMNTLLHVFEAYTELYRVDKNPKVKEKLLWMMDIIADKVYNEKLQRQEVFFDENWNSILDLHSYGHDIETAWLVDRSLSIINEEAYTEKLLPITKALTKKIYETAFDGHSVANECDRGVRNEWRVWWVQAESIVGFINGYEKTKEESYKDAAAAIWDYIEAHLIDKRESTFPGREWYWHVTKEGKPDEEADMVEPWKCPYHNGRMCFEVIKREVDF